MPVDADEAAGCLGLAGRVVGFLVFELLLEKRWFRMLLYSLAMAILYGMSKAYPDLPPSEGLGLWLLIGFITLVDLGFGFAKLQRGDRFWS